MEPLSVFRTIWAQRRFAIPAVILTIAAAALVFVFGPREYQATVSYALVDPQAQVPTAADIKDDPSLGLLNYNNPYLRSSDPNLIANVLVTRLNSQSTQQSVEDEGYSTDYTATQGDGGAGLIVNITGAGASNRQAIDATDALGARFERDLRTIQKVDGADDDFLYTAIVIEQPDQATEKISSRLRTVIIVAVAGIILIFGAVSIGNAIDRRRARIRAASEREPDAADEPASEPAAAAADRGSPPPTAQRSGSTRAAGSAPASASADTEEPAVGPAAAVDAVSSPQRAPSPGSARANTGGAPRPPRNRKRRPR